MGKPLMVIPEAVTLERTGSTGMPRLLGPSPEMSITCRALVNSLLLKVAAANSKPPEIEVPLYRAWVLADNRVAKACAASSLLIKVQGTTIVWLCGLDHST